MSQESERFDLLNDLNNRILEIRDQLSGRKTDDLLTSLSLAFFDLGSIFEELEIVGLVEICEDMQQILAMANNGKRPFNSLVKECILLTVGLMYRKAINNEPCYQELEDLAILVQGVKLGDNEGFEVTDHKIPLDEDDQIVMFDADEDDQIVMFDADEDDQIVLFDADEDDQIVMFDADESVVLFDADESVVLFDDDTEEQEGKAEKKKPTSNIEFDSTVLATNPTGTRSLNMLIVDDELYNRTIMKHIVSAFGICDFAVNGVEAVHTFQVARENDQPYDVVFMDILMPEMDGHQALKGIRAFEREVNTPQVKDVVVFMVTCLSSHDNVCKAFFKGYCTDYITKPIRSSKIIAKMREYKLLDN